MFDGLIAFLDQALMFGYEKLSEAKQREIVFSLPTTYAALKTHGMRLAESTITEYDDKAIQEAIQFCEILGEREGRLAIAQLKEVDFSK